MRSRRKIARGHELLARAYGRQRLPPSQDHLDELIGTILSQHTSDVNSQRPFHSSKGLARQKRLGTFSLLCLIWGVSQYLKPQHHS